MWCESLCMYVAVCVMCLCVMCVECMCVYCVYAHMYVYVLMHICAFAYTWCIFPQDSTDIHATDRRDIYTKNTSASPYMLVTQLSKFVLEKISKIIIIC